MQAGPPRTVASLTIGESLEIPQIDKDASATRGVRVRCIDATLDVAEAGLTEHPLLCQRLERPVPRSRGHE